MRSYPYLVVILLLASNASAECRDKECMPNQYTAEWENVTDWIFYYDSVFTIGDNWFIIFEREGPSNPDTITFEFAKGPSKITDFDNNVTNDTPKKVKNTNKLIPDIKTKDNQDKQTNKV